MLVGTAVFMVPMAAPRYLVPAKFWLMICAPKMDSVAAPMPMARRAISRFT